MRRNRVVGIVEDRIRGGVGHLREGVDDRRSDLAHRLDDALAVRRRTDVRKPNVDDEFAAQRLGDVGNRRQPQQGEGGVGFFVQRRRPLAKRAHDRRGVLAGIVDAAAVEPVDRHQVDCHLSDDAEISFAAAKAPKQVGLALGCRFPDDAIRGHHRKRLHVVGGKAEGAPEQRQPAARGVADDADVRIGPA